MEDTISQDTKRIEWRIFLDDLHGTTARRTPMGHAVAITSDSDECFVRVFVAHGFLVKTDKTEECQIWSSMTGQIFDLRLRYHDQVLLGEYTYAVAYERLDWDRVFYPDRDKSNVAEAKKWFLNTAIRLMKKWWEQATLQHDPDKIKELKSFVEDALKTIQEKP